MAKNFEQSKRKKVTAAKAAFTLAEVLITLAIIGVVAALTIPTLLNNYNDKVLETRYKKAVNIMTNGFKLMMSNEQVFDVKDLAIMQCSDIDCYLDEYKKVFKIVRDNSSPDIMQAFGDAYTIPIDNQKISFAGNEEQAPLFQTADGISYMGMPQSSEINFYADLNGRSEPNTFGKDMFMFSLSGNGLLTDETSILLAMVTCSLENLRACTTEADCMKIREEEINTQGGSSIIWKDNHCIIAVH